MILKKQLYYAFAALFILSSLTLSIKADTNATFGTLPQNKMQTSQTEKKEMLYYDKGPKHLKDFVFEVMQEHKDKVIVLPISLFDATEAGFQNPPITSIHGRVKIESEKIKDLEYLGSLEQYLQQYPDFVKRSNHIDLEKIRKIAEQELDEREIYELEREESESDDPEYENPNMSHRKELIAALNRIFFLFDLNRIEYKVVLEPLYESEYLRFDKEEIQEFLDDLAQETDFYDFTYSAISKDPRYFYNVKKIRKSVQSMILQTIAGEESSHGTRSALGDAFGHYVKKGSTYNMQAPKEILLEKKIKVLILHHIADVGKKERNSAIISKKRLEELFNTIREKGYQVIRLQDIIHYVKNGRELPEKPLLLTFDDGYLSNYEIVYPMVKQYGYSAVFFPIGVSIGKNTYKDTGKPIIAHYTMEHIQEMAASGHIEIGSHGYDIHQNKALEVGQARESILKLPHETQQEYEAFINKDFRSFERLFADFDFKIHSMAYPLGFHDELSDRLTVQNGMEITFTTRSGDSFLLKGLDQSMLNLNRINIDMKTDLHKVLP